MSNTLEPSELTQSIGKLVSIAEDMRGHLLSKARDAIDENETNWLAHVSSEARDVEDCIAKLRSIDERLQEILTSTLGFEDGYPAKFEGLDAAIAAASPGASVATTNRRLRKIRTSVTQGEINQNLLTLTDPRKRGLIRIGEQFKIRLPDGQRFETDLVHPGNKLRERGRIGEFYRQYKIKPGDNILLEETESGIWTLRKEAASITPTPQIMKSEAQASETGPAQPQRHDPTPEPHLPNRADLEEPLLNILIDMGGSVEFASRGREIEVLLAKQVGLSDADRDFAAPNYNSEGNRKWRNHIQFVREQLVSRNPPQIDNSRYGFWTVTSAGYRRVARR